MWLVAVLANVGERGRAPVRGGGPSISTVWRNFFLGAEPAKGWGRGAVSTSPWPADSELEELSEELEKENA